MTGELCDAFATRRDGVVGLAEIAARHLGQPRLYAGAAGFVAVEDAAAEAARIASANWRASAEAVALHESRRAADRHRLDHQPT